MGSGLLLLSAPPMDCRCRSKSELDTINFIINYWFLAF
jgi:hypothetical protein